MEPETLEARISECPGGARAGPEPEPGARGWPPFPRGGGVRAPPPHAPPPGPRRGGAPVRRSDPGSCAAGLGAGAAHPPGDRAAESDPQTPRAPTAAPKSSPSSPASEGPPTSSRPETFHPVLAASPRVQGRADSWPLSPCSGQAGRNSQCLSSEGSRLRLHERDPSSLSLHPAQPPSTSQMAFPAPPELPPEASALASCLLRNSFLQLWLPSPQPLPLLSLSHLAEDPWLCQPHSLDSAPWEPQAASSSPSRDRSLSQGLTGWGYQLNLLASGTPRTLCGVMWEVMASTLEAGLEQS